MYANRLKKVDQLNGVTIYVLENEPNIRLKLNVCQEYRLWRVEASAGLCIRNTFRNGFSEQSKITLQIKGETHDQVSQCTNRLKQGLGTNMAKVRKYNEEKKGQSRSKDRLGNVSDTSELNVYYTKSNVKQRWFGTVLNRTY